MGWFNTLFKITIGHTATYENAALDLQEQLGTNNKFNSDDLDKVNTIFTCIRILSDTVGKLPVMVKNDGERLNSHEIFPIVRFRPNSYQTAFTFFKTLIVHMCYYGNAYARIHKTDGYVTALHIIHPTNIQKAEITDAGNLRYTYTGADKYIYSEDILHFKWLSEDGVFGLNPIRAIFRQLSINYQGLQTIDKYYENGLHSGRYIKSIGDTSFTQFNQGVQSWQQNAAGSVNAGRIFSVPYGTEIKELRLEFADAQILDTMKFNTGQVAALYGVPGWMLGVEEMKYKSIEEGLLAFRTQTIHPVAEIFEAELSNKLLFDEEQINGTTIEHDIDKMLAADAATRSKYVTELVKAGIITRARAAKIEGYPADEKLDFHTMQAQDQVIEAVVTKENDKWDYNPKTQGLSNTSNSKQDENE